MKNPLSKLNLRLGTNLFLVGGTLVSYQTAVAQVKGDALLVQGKFSKTTSKHVGLAQRLLHLNVERAERRPYFNELPYGARCEPPAACLSKAASLAIAAQLGEQRSKGEPLSLINALVASHGLHNRGDAAKISRILSKRDREVYDGTALLAQLGLL